MGKCDIKSQIESRTDRLNDVRYGCEQGHEECYAHNHEENREAIKELIDALYADDELNIEFIKERLDWLAKDYAIDFDRKKPMSTFVSISEDELFGFLGDWLEKHSEIADAIN